MDLFRLRYDVIIVLNTILYCGHCQKMGFNYSSSDEIQETTVTSSHYHRKSFLKENVSTKIFATKDNRHEYDFLYSEQNCHFVPKQKVSSNRGCIHLKNILATFNSEDGGLVVDAREGISEVREPTLPEAMFDNLEFESVHESEPQNVHLNEENDTGTISQIENSESLEKSIRLEKNSAKPLGITKGKEDYDFLFSDFNVKPLQRNAKNLSVKVEDLRNVVNLFNSDDGGFVPIGKKSEEKSNENEPTLPAIFMGSEDLHVSRDSGSAEQAKSNIQSPKHDKSKGINSDVTIEQTDGSSDVYHKNFKADTVSNEHSFLKHYKHHNLNDEFKNNLFHQKHFPFGANKPSTPNEIDAIVNDFIAAQRKHIISTIRPITHFLNASLEETAEKYTSRKRKGRTKTTTNKKTVPRSTKRRGRPKKSSVPCSTWLENKKVKLDKKCTTKPDTTQAISSTKRTPPTTKTSIMPTKLIKLLATNCKSVTIENTGRHKINREETSLDNRPRIEINGTLHLSPSSPKSSTNKVSHKPNELFTNKVHRITTSRFTSHITTPAEKRNVNTRTSLKIPNTGRKTTQKNLVHSNTNRFEKPSRIKSSEFVEESLFTVEPIPDSNMYTEFNMFHFRKHKVKTTTPALKLFKTYNDRLLYIKELFGNDGLVTVTSKRPCTNVSLFNLNEAHVGIGTLNSRLTNLNVPSLIEVEEIPIVDFKEPLRIIDHKRRQSQHPWNFKIGSWNVNGIRAWAKKDGFSFMNQHDLNAFCIQEVRCPMEKIPKCPAGYHAFWFPGTKQGYAGVAILSKTKPMSVTNGFILNQEDPMSVTNQQDHRTDDIGDGRILTVEYEQFYLVNVYAPASKQDLSMLHVKLSWNSLLHDHLRILNQMKPVVLAGDFNVAHECIDVALPLTNLGKSCFTREERDYFSKFLSLGFVDTYRHLYPSHRIYTYWPYYDRPSKLNGWRLDYFIISSQLVSKLTDQEIHCDVDGSDHAPQILYLNI